MCDSKTKKDTRFYGRRSGKKLRRPRRTLIEKLLPLIEIAEPKSDKIIEPAALFAEQKKEIWLEIGFGGGEHLAEQAKKNSDIGIIGSEVFINGVASLLAHLSGSYENGIHSEDEAVLEKDRTDNVRIFPDDVRKLLPRLKEASFDRIFVLFPDPWPKKRHSERRFICKENLGIFARLLKDGGKLRIASDDVKYINWALMHTTSHSDFKWTAQKAADWRIRPDDGAETRYEAKAIQQGRKPVYLDFIRLPKK